MDIAISASVLIFLAALTWAALLLRRHGLAGCLYQASARLAALADAIATGQERHRRSLAEYRDEARTATRAIQEAL